MKKGLLIAEKHSLMMALKDAYRKSGLKDDITFTHASGHLLSLKYPGEYDEKWKKWDLEYLPIIPGEFTYKVINKDLLNKIKKELDSGKYDYVINAGDAEREGQLIVRSILKHLNCDLPVKRIWIQDMSEKGLVKSFREMEDDNSPRFSALTDASYLRSYLDWLIGMNISRAITLKTNATIPIGRVMTPLLNIIVQREKDINNFVPKDFYEIFGEFDKGYKGKWFKVVDGKNVNRFYDKEEAEELIKKIKENPVGVVENVERKKARRYSPSLHSLTELQIEANKVYGYSGDKTLSIAQSLYQERKLLTYPRTDSQHLPKNMAETLPGFLSKITDIEDFGDHIREILKDQDKINKAIKNKRYVDDSKVSDHFAIIPTDVVPNFSKLTNDEVNIYKLVLRRVVGMFMDPQITNRTIITTNINGELFDTKGNILVDDGFAVLYKYNNKDVHLPDVNKGDKVSLNEIELNKGQTTPPSRFNESDLLSVMEDINRLIEDESLRVEKLSLGTVATTADILNKIVENKMVVKKKNIYYPEKFGEDIIDVLDDRSITKPELTAIWEKKLKAVESQEMTYDEFYEEMKSYIKDITKDIIENVNKDLSQYNKGNNKKGKSKQEIIGKCPVCNSDVILSNKFILCSEYKKTCKFIISRNLSGAFLTKKDCKDMMRGKESGVKDFKFKSGKTGTASIKVNNKGGLDFIFKN